MAELSLVKLPSNEYHSNLYVSIGSGNGLEPSGNKPLPKPVMM